MSLMCNPLSCGTVSGMPVWNGCDEAAVFPVDLVVLLLFCVFHDG